MRVLHVTQPTEAGVPTVVRQLSLDQRRHGLEVVVAAPTDGHLVEWLERDGTEHRPWSATRDPGPSVLAETRSLDAVVRDVRPDLVHLHSAKAGLAGRLALRGRLPTVFQPHAWSFEAVGGLVGAAAVRWERTAGRWTDVVVCISADERDRAVRAGVRCRMEVLPNGVDLAVFHPPQPGEREQARRQLGLPDGPLVVCVGRLARQKGQEVLLAALPRLREQVPALTAVLVGDGPDRAGLESAAPAGVVFAGTRVDVRTWLVAADVVVLPSRWEAGSSLAVMEAMAVERSVVSTDVAGNADVLRDCGAVVPVDDAQALAEAVLERLLHPDLAAAEGARGRRRVEGSHDQTATAQRMRAVYDSVLELRAGERTGPGSGAPRG